MTVFLFGGQGSQYYGMGRQLYLKHPLFKETADGLDSVASELLPTSVLQVVYDQGKGLGDKFTRTRFSHPAIFIVQYSLAHLLMEEGITPSIICGTSLGEFVSAAVAGILTPEDALRAVILQGIAIEEHCRPGGMIAIFHDASLYGNSSVIRSNTELVAVNHSSHFVVSGSEARLENVVAFLKDRALRFQILPVSHPFHSALLDPALEPYSRQASSLNFAPPKIPLVSCVEGRRIAKLDGRYLWKAARDPILFREAVAELEEGEAKVYLDLGVGDTLAGFCRRNLREGSASVCHSVITPFHQELKNLASIRKITAGKRYRPERKRTMTTHVFPGQGSQFKGMGGELFHEFPEITAQADAILGYSIESLCIEDVKRQLSQTQYTQPALYTVNALGYLKKLKETGKRPDYVAGHSLGEYNALFAAGCFDFETGLKLVKKRGEVMSLASGGGMAAVIGMPPEKIREVLQRERVDTIDVANFNGPSQTVIAGPKAEIINVASFFAAPAANYIPLNVSAAFHSRYMEPSQQEFAKYLEQFDFCEPTMPVISNVHARPYKVGEIKKNLVAQITSSVRWTESIRYLMGRGEMSFEEVGPGNVLTKLVQNIQRECLPLVDIESKEPAEPVKEPPGPPASQPAHPVQSVQSKPSTSSATAPIGRAGPPPSSTSRITPSTLGCAEFKKDYNLTYAYLAGSMYQGISSPELVVKMGKGGFLGFLGAGGLRLDQIEKGIVHIKDELRNGEPYGVNLLHNPNDPEREEAKVDLFLKHQVKILEASAYISVTPALIRYRAQGLTRQPDGTVSAANRVIGKVSRPEVAEALMSPAPEWLVAKVVQEKRISQEQAQMLRQVPISDDLCVEADSGGHTDAGVAYALMPAMLRLRDDMMKKHRYRNKIRIGAAGGIGTPEAAAAAFILGADFILSGSVNQCTIEARTSDVVKDMLQQMNVQDTGYAPAGDMFELGARIQVLKRGVFFQARANRLYEIYRQYNSLEEIDDRTRTQLQERYFKKSFEDVYHEMTSYLTQEEREKIERNPKQRMLLVFSWYFKHSTQLALSGAPRQEVDYQIQCGPALGAFNQWVKGSPLENWRQRHVDAIGVKLMQETAELLNERLRTLALN